VCHEVTKIRKITKILLIKKLRVLLVLRDFVRDEVGNRYDQLKVLEL